MLAEFEVSCLVAVFVVALLVVPLVLVLALLSVLPLVLLVFVLMPVLVPVLAFVLALAFVLLVFVLAFVLVFALVFVLKMEEDCFLVLLAESQALLFFVSFLDWRLAVVAELTSVGLELLWFLIVVFAVLLLVFVLVLWLSPLLRLLSTFLASSGSWQIWASSGPRVLWHSP